MCEGISIVDELFHPRTSTERFEESKSNFTIEFHPVNFYTPNFFDFPNKSPGGHQFNEYNPIAKPSRF